MNRNETYGAVATNQIAALSAAGYFSATVTNNPATLVALATATNTSASLEFRARSFLAANCSQCHQPGGAAQRANWDARISTSTAASGLIKGVPVNNFGSTNNFIITPQSPANSVLLTRISARDLGQLPSIQMPPLDSTVVDTQDVQLVTDWINSLPLSGKVNTPIFNLLRMSGAGLVFGGSNGWPGGNYSVLTSSNLVLPPSQWHPLFTNPFDPAGGFNFTNPMDANNPRLFYLLQLQ
jgi:hypothetical protein